MIQFYTDKDYQRRLDENGGDSGEYRSAFRRDYARLVHCPAFRRLQGKTQLFPGIESDFFRNRLTHSLEVAQISKSISIKFNDSLIKEKLVDPLDPYGPLDVDLIETAGLAHDLGHPPFGHNGERALDDCMKQYGGFEGNAQTLRIIAVLEKKIKAGRADDVAYGVNDEDCRYGLNPTYRTLAAVLKYNTPIGIRRAKNSKLMKGYYSSDLELVKEIKKHVSSSRGSFRTVECEIMEAADDIAYSTYDIEDALKAGFLNPLDFFSSHVLLSKVVKKVHEALEKRKGGKPTDYDRLSRKKKDKLEDNVISTALKLFVSAGLFSVDRKVLDAIFNKTSSGLDPKVSARVLLPPQIYKNAKNLSAIGYDRTDFTSKIVGRFIRGVTLEVNKKKPALSKVMIDDKTFLEIEVLKQLAYCSQIMSPRLKVAEYRGYDIVQTIFCALDAEGGYNLLPDDFQRDYLAASKVKTRKRVICDFIAGMTDRYAIEFYARLKSENAESIFKPL
ncbi:MAG: dNTP triphosphohydrolase [Magnetovibrio sp.]|nr:dNTP triphosphohydrolase [Magnetovibrio sp.]